MAGNKMLSARRVKERIRGINSLHRFHCYYKSKMVVAAGNRAPVFRQVSHPQRYLPVLL